MKRTLALAALAIALATACGKADPAFEPTPRPEGQRGSILNPIDRAKKTADDANQQQQQMEQRTGGEDPGEYPGYEP